MSETEGAWTDLGKINIADVRIADGRQSDAADLSHTAATDPIHTILDKRGLFVIHAVMLHTGKVLWFCGHVEDGHYALKSYLYDYKHPNAQLVSHDFPVHNSHLARSGTNFNLPNNPETGHFHADLFCCHFVHTADGKVLVVGGSDPDFGARRAAGTPFPSVGEAYIYLFDPDANRQKGKWKLAQNGSTVSNLTQGRWYPTAVMLGDGRIAVVSGRLSFTEIATAPLPAGTPVSEALKFTTAEKVDILTPPHYKATPLTNGDIRLPIYPGLHLAPNGRIYYTHTTWAVEFSAPTNTQSIEIANGATTASWTDHSGVAPSQPRREEGMSVLLPPANDGKILLFGGSEARKANGQPYQQLPVPQGNSTVAGIASASDPTHSEILDTTGANPVWGVGPTLRKPRINGHGVILPDKTVLIFGGHDKFKWWNIARGCTPSLECELFDPALFDPTNPTATPNKIMASLKQPRRYHSAAVLLPDGSVLVAGGADPDHTESNVHSGPPDNFAYPGIPPLVNPRPANVWQGPVMTNTTAYNRKDYEIFKPTYFFTPGTRPVINSIKKNGAVTTKVDYGDTIHVNSPQASAINEVALIRPGAATHHTDSEQRYVELVSTRIGNDLVVTIPTNRNLCPPGYYMLWIVETGGKPCEEAKFLLVGDVWKPPPPTPPATTTSDNESKLCVVVTAATGSPNAPEVMFLRGLRLELIQSGIWGLRFIRVVNRLYYSVAPQIAAEMQQRPRLLRAVREVVVRPGVALVRWAKRVSGYRGGRAYSVTLMAILSGMGLTGLALLPLIAMAVGLHWLAAPDREDSDG